MFVFLSKLLPPFIYPAGLTFLLIAAALLLDRRPRARRVMLLAALLVVLVGGNRWVAAGLARSLEWRYLPPQEIPVADAIVLLGGGTHSAGGPRRMVGVNQAGDRVLYAAKVFKEGKAPYILSSGGVLDWVEAPRSPAEDMAELLEMMGVPGEAIWLQGRSRNTYEDAVYSAEILREKGVQHILLITSASHMPRSVKLFEAQGLEVTPLPVDYDLTYEDWQGLIQRDWRAQLVGLLPSAENMTLNSRLLKEYIGMLVYDWMGWY